MVGAQIGADTTRPETKAGAGAFAPATAPTKPPESKASNETKAIMALLAKHTCLACHGVDKKIVGPALADIAKKNAGNADYLTKKIKLGGSGVWGAIPMPPQSLSDADARAIATWLAAGANK